MPSPFPGMDPYLEGYLWVDVHNALANKIRQQLAPRLRPRYTARLEVYLVQDTAPESEIGILYPDVEVLRRKNPANQIEEPLPGGTGNILVTPAPLTLPILQPVDVRLTNVEIRDTANNILVTCIEILSPLNKREPGLAPYRQKRQRLHAAKVHLIEIDLLRRGTRPFDHPRLPEVPYFVTLTRAQTHQVEIWPIRLQDELPTIPVPLREPDPDVPLDLAMALREIYDEASYDLSVNYLEPPPKPPLTEDEQCWLEELLSRFRESNF